jgi:hypothetical protein
MKIHILYLLFDHCSKCPDISNVETFKKLSVILKNTQNPKRKIFTASHVAPSRLFGKQVDFFTFVTPMRKALHMLAESLRAENTVKNISH